LSAPFPACPDLGYRNTDARQPRRRSSQRQRADLGLMTRVNTMVKVAAAARLKSIASSVRNVMIALGQVQSLRR
jgi:hypothetical protein